MKLLINHRKLIPLFVIFSAILFFFAPTLFQGKLPIPSDDISGLYHPWRDKIINDFPQGLPFKNFLITDPVRQQIPWRLLSIDSIKNGELPLWNPYNFGGMPLLANLQSAPLYPLNFIFAFLPFLEAWTILIILEFILGGFFFYLYLSYFKLDKLAIIFGVLAWIFSGFFISWAEWGTLIHTAIWLPLLLLCVEKIHEGKKRWGLLFITSVSMSLLAGHLQIAFYVLSFAVLYFLAKVSGSNNKKSETLFFIIIFSSAIIITLPQLLPTFDLIGHSARSIDQSNWKISGWFIPWQNIVQFVAPDFFGNPSTLNYWGIFNYAEFVGYIGIIPLAGAFLAVLLRKDKKTRFFGFTTLLALSFALPFPWAKTPFLINFPLLSTSQPTRLIFLVDFSLAVLSSLGLDYLIKNLHSLKFGKLFIKIIAISSLLLCILFVSFLWANIAKQSDESVNLHIAVKNMILPILLISSTSILLLITKWSQNKTISVKKITLPLTKILFVLLVFISFLDLYRFANKFTPFTSKKYFFPETETTKFLTNNLGHYRFMSTDAELFPPNFSIVYKLQSVDGYDPLYLKEYGELINISEGGVLDIGKPLSFNRIITPRKYESEIMDLLGVKYVLSLRELNSSKLVQVFTEGKTKIYENMNVFPRAYLVGKVLEVKDSGEALKTIKDSKTDLLTTAVVEKSQKMTFSEITDWKNGIVRIENYSDNKIEISVLAENLSLLILTDAFYPTWQAKVSGSETKIYRVDHALRAIIIPKGEHKVEFSISKII